MSYAFGEPGEFRVDGAVSLVHTGRGVLDLGMSGAKFARKIGQFLARFRLLRAQRGQTCQIKSDGDRADVSAMGARRLDLLVMRTSFFHSRLSHGELLIHFLQLLFGDQLFVRADETVPSLEILDSLFGGDQLGAQDLEL